MNRDFTRTIVKNTFATLVAKIWFSLVGLLLTPFILTVLGPSAYGIWILIPVLAGYFGLLDFGFATSFAKHIAEYDARGDQRGVNGVFTAGLAFYLGLTATAIAVVFLGSDLILDYLRIPSDLAADARFALQVGIIAFLASNLIVVYLSVINGLQQMHVSNAIMIFMSGCNTAGCVLVLMVGFGLRGLVVNQLVTHVIGIVATAYFAHRLYPGLHFRARLIPAYFPVLFRYGLNLQVSNVAVLVNFHFDKLLISRVLGMSSVALYDLGSRIPASLRTFPTLFLSVLTPATSELEARRGRGDTYELFFRASKYVSVVAFPLLLGAIATGPAMIQAWVGDAYPRSASILRILCVGYLLNVVSGAVSPLVQGIGRPEYQRNAEVVSLLLNVVLSLLLITRYGLYGAALGTASAMSIAAGYYLWSFHRLMDRPLLPFLKDAVLKPAGCAGVGALIAFAVTSTLMPFTSGGRMEALAVLLAAGFTFGISYVVLLWRCRYLDDWDMALLRGHLPVLRP